MAAGSGECLVAAAEHLAKVRRHKEAAFDAGDRKAAAASRARERPQLAGKLRMEQQLMAGVAGQAVIEGNQRLRRELDRLRDLLRQHGIEPHGDTAQSG